MTSADKHDDRFTVQSAVEVAYILNAVMQSGQMVTAHYGDGADFLVTAILAINRQAAEVLLDASRDAESNRRLVNAAKVSFVTSQDRVKVQFKSDQVRLVTHAGRPALRIPLPQSLLKFQRREFYRVDTPVIKPVRCRLMMPEGPVDTVVVDISLGGLCLTGFPDTLRLEAGMKIEDNLVDLGEAGQFSVSLQVRSMSNVQLRNGNNSRRAGCMFLKLPPGAEALLQRYIIRLERDQRAKGIDPRR